MIVETDANIVLGETGVAEVMQNVKVILTTRKGTVPGDRNFGLDFSFLDTPTPQARAQVQVDIFLQVQRYEPRAEIREIAFDFDMERMMPKVRIGIREGA